MTIDNKGHKLLDRFLEVVITQKSVDDARHDIAEAFSLLENEGWPVAIQHMKAILSEMPE